MGKYHGSTIELWKDSDEIAYKINSNYMLGSDIIFLAGKQIPIQEEKFEYLNYSKWYHEE